MAAVLGLHGTYTLPCQPLGSYTKDCSFETRDACEEVIRAFNNHSIDSAGEELQIQIRYADTQEQKSLKQQTQAARQFRSAEYEYATHELRQGRLPFAGHTTHDTQQVNEFDQYLGTTANVPIQGQRWAQSAIRQVPGRSPLAGMPPYNGSAQMPSVQVNVAPGSDVQAATPKADKVVVDIKPIVTAPAVAHANSPVDSATTSDHE